MLAFRVVPVVTRRERELLDEAEHLVELGVLQEFLANPEYSLEEAVLASLEFVGLYDVADYWRGKGAGS